VDKYAEIRADLLRKRDQLQGRVRAIQEEVGHASKPLEQDFEEQAVQRENEEVLDALDRSARIELDQIERALERMTGDAYEQCAVCGGEIPLARLRVLPYTDRCVVCAERLGA
jgi:RNA polymerase-binding transcription factor DksA